jgi:hypothetical protein
MGDTIRVLTALRGFGEVLDDETTEKTDPRVSILNGNLSSSKHDVRYIFKPDFMISFVTKVTRGLR